LNLNNASQDLQNLFSWREREREFELKREDFQKKAGILERARESLRKSEKVLEGERKIVWHIPSVIPLLRDVKNFDVACSLSLSLSLSLTHSLSLSLLRSLPLSRFLSRCRCLPITTVSILSLTFHPKPFFSYFCLFKTFPSLSLFSPCEIRFLLIASSDS
jgi:hypothetical protein